MSEGKSWADDDGLPSPQIIENEDGTKTIISYKYNDANKKVKVTQKIKEITIKEKVHPNVAARKKWEKFGSERGSKPGPDIRTTQVGEPVFLRLGTEWKQIEQEAAQQAKEQAQKANASQGLTCRTCGGKHFTSKCPYKEQLGVDPDAALDEDSGMGGADVSVGDADKGKGGSGYVPPHLRKRLIGAGLDEDNKKAEEDSSTLRISQLNESVDEGDLYDLLDQVRNSINRLTLVRDRETGRSRGFAYVEFMTPSIARSVAEKIDGRGFRSLILKAEISKARRQ